MEDREKRFNKKFNEDLKRSEEKLEELRKQTSKESDNQIMARPTTHELDDSESNSPPMERPTKIGEKPEYNSDWNSIKKAVRD